MNFTVRDLMNALVGKPADAIVMVDFHRDGPCQMLKVDKVSEGTKADVTQDEKDYEPVIWIQVSRPQVEARIGECSDEDIASCGMMATPCPNCPDPRSSEEDEDHECVVCDYPGSVKSKSGWLCGLCAPKA